MIKKRFKKLIFKQAKRKKRIAPPCPVKNRNSPDIKKRSLVNRRLRPSYLSYHLFYFIGPCQGWNNFPERFLLFSEWGNLRQNHRRLFSSKFRIYRELYQFARPKFFLVSLNIHGQVLFRNPRYQWYKNVQILYTVFLKIFTPASNYFVHINGRTFAVFRPTFREKGTMLRTFNLFQILPG